ncbi:MAG: ACT domain-containing protein [Actinomycetota bacterium]|nr:ACT domain-containing protein [Actinomycetota bacterium]
MANHAAVTVIGNDRPGIVAGVTKALYEVGCNLEDVSSTILRGHFSMMLVIRTPEDVDSTTIEERLDPVARDLGLVVTARPVEESHVEVTAPTHMVSVYGADKPGIVFRVTETLARLGINITDLLSRVIGPADKPVYALMLEVSASDPAALERELDSLQSELGVDVSVHPLETDVL